MSASRGRPIRLGLLGLGTVGLAAYDLLRRNQDEITRRSGHALQVVAVARRDTEAARRCVDDSVQVLADGHALVTHAEVDVVVELMGGIDPAKQWVLAAIDAGKHVVTANKALLALHGNEIFARARERGVVVAFEAAVAGGIPIIKTLREGLSANRIQWVAGIINGTTNFILTQMRQKGLDFSSALAQAQALGYAEADPTFDIEGVDAAHKIALVSAMAFGVRVQFDRVHVEGITQLQAADMRYAEQLGYRIKLLGITKRVDNGVELRVHPTLLPQRSLLASVEDAMNAVMVCGDAVGSTLYYGKGAGGDPTASAVVADVLDVARLMDADAVHHAPALAFQPSAVDDGPVLPQDEVVTSYYLRLRVRDEAGVLAQLTAILAQRHISLDAVIQREAQGDEATPHTDLIVLTHAAREGVMNQAIAAMQALDVVVQPVVRLRREVFA
jgi:homoserine dehydrogenase